VLSVRGSLSSEIIDKIQHVKCQLELPAILMALHQNKCHLLESFADFYEKVCHAAVKYDESAIGASQATKALPNALLLLIRPRLLQICLQSRLRTFCSCGKTFGKKWRNIIVNGNK
jgi:hypothetical protein